MMEMEGRALQHVMNLQTQLMQEILKMQKDQERNALFQQASFQYSSSNEHTQNRTSDFQERSAPITNPTSPMFTHPTFFEERQRNAFSSQASMSISDPTKYGTYAAPYFEESRQEQAAVPSFLVKGIISGVLAEMKHFDPMNFSKERTDQFINSQARDIQEQAINSLSGTIGGATAGASLFLPGGIITSLLLGTAATAGANKAGNVFVGEVKEALNYQEVLQEKGYKFFNAFESTSELGGIGMGLEQRQETSKFLRHLATEKFLNEEEMTTILEGAADHKLLKSVKDVKSFQEKFSKIVDAVKQISISMNQSLEEATAFMGEMEARGISTKDMSLVAAGIKVSSSMSGMTPTEGYQRVFETTDQVTQGTSLDATGIAQDSAKSIFMAQTLQERAKAEGNDQIYHYLKNEGADHFGSRFNVMGREYVLGNQSLQYLSGLYASAYQYNSETDTFAINDDKMKSLLKGELSLDDMEKQARDTFSKWDTATQDKFYETSGMTFSHYASDSAISAFIKQNAQLLIDQSGGKMSFDQALVKLGIAGNYDEAKAFEGMIGLYGDEKLNKSYTAKVLKDHQDANAISTNPGLKKEWEYWWQNKFGDPLGDKAQDLSDPFAREAMELQQFILGIDDRSMVGGERLEDFTVEGAKKSVGDTENYNKFNTAPDSPEGVIEDFATGKLHKDVISGRYFAQVEQERIDKIAEHSKTDVFTSGHLDYYSKKLKQGPMDDEIRVLKERLDSGDVGFNIAERQRIQFAIDKATGEYDDWWEQPDYWMDSATVEAGNALGEAYNATIGKWTGQVTGKDANEFDAYREKSFTAKEVGKEIEAAKKKKKKLITKRSKLFTSDDYMKKTPDERKAISAAIEEGKVKKVKELTNNDEDSVELAKEFKDFNKEDEEIKATNNQLDDMYRQTKGVATAPIQLGDSLKASGVFSDSDIDALLGDIVEKGTDLTKELKKGKITPTEMFDKQTEILAEMENTLEYMPKNALLDYLSYLDEQDDSVTMKDFQDEKGEINTEVVQEYIMNMLRDQHTGEVVNPEGKDDPSNVSTNDAVSAAEKHQKAMEAFVGAFANETKLLESAVGGPPADSEGNKTSVQTRLSGIGAR